MVHIDPNTPLGNVAALQAILSEDTGDEGIHGKISRTDQGDPSNGATMKTSDGSNNATSGASAGGDNDKRKCPLGIALPPTIGPLEALAGPPHEATTVIS